jgi:hypothetical protein
MLGLNPRVWSVIESLGLSEEPFQFLPSFVSGAENQIWQSVPLQLECVTRFLPRLPSPRGFSILPIHLSGCLWSIDKWSGADSAVAVECGYIKSEEGLTGATNSSKPVSFRLHNSSLDWE